MTLDEIEARIISRLTPEQLAAHKQGCAIVDYYMTLACDDSLPVSVKDHARAKLRAFALRSHGQTVADVDGLANQ